jgi:hypothetical protein
MAPHDPLFKKLIQTFFASFLRLVAPEVAARLDLSAPVFLDKEFTDSAPPGRSRVVDLLARLPLRDSQRRSLLVHVEIEARARGIMAERLREYHHWIQVRHKDQILSVVVYLKGGREGLCEEGPQGDLIGPGLPGFRYLSFSLASCSAAAYLASPEPLAWALAALMDPGDWSRNELRTRCMNRIAEAPLTVSEQFELVNCVETYLQFASGDAAESSSAEISKIWRQQVMSMTWADVVLLEAREQGARSMLLYLIEERFGPVPEDVQRRIQGIRSQDRLKRLAGKVLTAKSLKDLKLG